MVSDLNEIKEAVKTIMHYSGALTHETAVVVKQEVRHLRFYAKMALKDEDIDIELFNEYEALASHVCECITEFHENNLIEVAQWL